MEEAIFEVEIITPTIMGGANSKKLDSIFIRPTEIKSAMRQAFRLVAGKYVEHDNKGVEDLYKLESEIFGNTEGKGKFRLIVEADDIETEEKVLLLPHKKPKDDRERVLGEKIKLPRKVIKPNQIFNLRIMTYKKIEPYENPVEFYKALLNIAFMLGVGYRRNRLLGNMQIKQIKLKDKIEQIEQFEWKDEIQKISKFFVAKKLEEIETNDPLFACFSKREDSDDRNFTVYSIPLKDEYTPIEQNFEKALKNLYNEVIHEIKRKKLDFILGEARPRQASFVNFSILKFGQNYRLFVIGFYYKNKKFEYNNWKNAIEKAKELAEKTFKK